MRVRLEFSRRRTCLRRGLRRWVRRTGRIHVCSERKPDHPVLRRPGQAEQTRPRGRGSPGSVDTSNGLILLLAPGFRSCHVTAGAQVVSRWSPRRPVRAEEERPGLLRAPADTGWRRSGGTVRPPSRPGGSSRSPRATSCPARSGAGDGCTHRSTPGCGPVPATWLRSAPGRAVPIPGWSARTR